MKAWRFTGVHEPLVREEVPEPVAAPGEVVVEIRAAGLCHSDVGFLEDERVSLPPGGKVPMTLGHEIAGVISELGEGVTGWAVGDRVGIGLFGHTHVGLTRDGGYASAVAADARDLLAIPDGVSFAQAAAGTDAGMTSYSAVVTRGGAKRGDKVGIIGFGGVGQVGAQVAAAIGCEVFVADIKESVWPAAMAMGAKRVAKDIAEFADENLDLIVDFAGFGTTTEAAIATVRRRGRVLLVGMGAVGAPVSTAAILMNEVTLLGSFSGSEEAARAVYALMGEGRLSPVISTIGFDEIPEGIARLSRGEVIGRLVATTAD